MSADLAERLLDRDRSAVPLALNLVEDQRPQERLEAEAMLDRLQGHGEDALRIGITGAPGAGKSTLIDALSRAFRACGKSVGIIAVDPSSQRSGGALLGDRLRVRASIRDPGVYLRSMAARQSLGGLAEATHAGVEVLAAVFDVVIVETVGVGQSESDINDLVHTLIFVAQPKAGDSIQFMKAGILEFPDIFVINKADLGPEAQQSQHELMGALGLSEARSDAWLAPALLTSARDGKGIRELIDSLMEHRVHLESSGGLEARLLEGRSNHVIRALSRRYGDYGIESIGGRDTLAERIANDEKISISRLLRQLGSEIEHSLSNSPVA